MLAATIKMNYHECYLKIAHWLTHINVLISNGFLLHRFQTWTRFVVFLGCILTSHTLRAMLLPKFSVWSYCLYLISELLENLLCLAAHSFCNELCAEWRLHFKLVTHVLADCHHMCKYCFCTHAVPCAKMKLHAVQPSVSKTWGMQNCLWALYCWGK